MKLIVSKQASTRCMRLVLPTLLCFPLQLITNTWHNIAVPHLVGIYLLSSFKWHDVLEINHNKLPHSLKFTPASNIFSVRPRNHRSCNHGQLIWQSLKICVWLHSARNRELKSYNPNVVHYNHDHIVFARPRRSRRNIKRSVRTRDGSNLIQKGFIQLPLSSSRS